MKCLSRNLHERVMPVQEDRIGGWSGEAKRSGGSDPSLRLETGDVKQNAGLFLLLILEICKLDFGFCPWL